ncbi:vesicle-associated membrane protein 3-like [Dendronephthya gigantea]|uniref:vesicle-associated membrane protein 3-like n=1 Tax=Dendronephthya gigantea TaxID=151771 RepID=UPI0010697B11|nr:vesicle-associated membrane protein 3-like [Dendronephthya gigantea]
MEKTRLLETQQQMDEVVDIMRDNLDNIIKRDDKLEKLERKSYQVKEDAKIFKQSAVGIKRKMWWRNRKMWIILIVVVLVIIAAIVVWFTALK